MRLIAPTAMGRPAYEPAMMVALLRYTYAPGNRSARGIERACVEDVAYRVICSNLVPDHSTIAEFRVRHEDALAELFTGVLGLCRRSGPLSVGVVAIDGTKVRANASRGASRSYEQTAREILAEAAEIDCREDELYGEARGDGLPERSPGNAIARRSQPVPCPGHRVSALRIRSRLLHSLVASVSQIERHTTEPDEEDTRAGASGSPASAMRTRQSPAGSVTGRPGVMPMFRAGLRRTSASPGFLGMTQVSA
jgi:transposase